MLESQCFTLVWNFYFKELFAQIGFTLFCKKHVANYVNVLFTIFNALYLSFVYKLVTLNKNYNT